MLYLIVSDDDGHWYIIPEEKKNEFESWVGENENWEVPDWAREIDGPHKVLIGSYQIRG